MIYNGYSLPLMTTSGQPANVLLVFQVYATFSSGGVSGRLLKHEQPSSSCLCFRSRLLVYLPSCGSFGLSHHHSNLKHQELSLEPVSMKYYTKQNIACA